MSLRAVSFDMGHTLVLPRYDVYAELLAAEGLEVAKEDLVRTEGRLRPWFDDEVRRGTDLDRAVWGDYYRLFFGGLGASEDRIVPMLETLLERHREGPGLWTEPVDDAQSVLDSLKERGLLLVCVSNNDGRLHRMVEHQGWNELFDLLVDSGTVGYSKPDPRIFEHALRQLRLEPEEIVHVGDYYSVDVEGARSAGIEGILYDPHGHYGAMDCPVIDRLQALLGWLDGQPND